MEGSKIAMMTEVSDVQHDLSPCSSVAIRDSLEEKGDVKDLSHEEHDEMRNMTFIDSGLSVLSVDEETTEIQKPEIQFNPTQCLFCNHKSIGLDESLEHMLQKHDLCIPDRPHLIVDIETLAEYLHLVIFVYFECLYCGSQRNNALAAQQHMMGKRHCKIDIQSEDSEFRDFYDFDSASEDSDDSEDSECKFTKPVTGYSKVTIVDNSMRLPSGKVLSHRTEGKSRFHRHQTADTNTQSALQASRAMPLNTSQHLPESDLGQPAPSESKKIARREVGFQNQLATLRDGDRRSLMHLSPTQQRAVLSKSRKQVEKGRKVENEMLLKIQLKANR